MKRILAAALAVTLMTGSVLAEAGDRDRARHSRHDERRAHRDHDRHASAHHHQRHVVRHHDDRRWRDRHNHHHVTAHRHVRFHVGHYHRPAGYRTYAWHRGARLPAAYYAPRYVVHDYHAYHLHRPPHGHHWVRVDRDVVLAAITTGAIVSVVNDLFY